MSNIWEDEDSVIERTNVKNPWDKSTYTRKNRKTQDWQLPPDPPKEDYDGDGGGCRYIFFVMVGVWLTTIVVLNWGRIFPSKHKVREQNINKKEEPRRSTPTPPVIPPVDTYFDDYPDEDLPGKTFLATYREYSGICTLTNGICLSRDLKPSFGITCAGFTGEATISSEDGLKVSAEGFRVKVEEELKLTNYIESHYHDRDTADVSIEEFIKVVQMLFSPDSGCQLENSLCFKNGDSYFEMNVKCDNKRLKLSTKGQVILSYDNLEINIGTQ